MSLEEKKCIPCQVDLPPLEPNEAKALLQDIPGWQLNADANRINRRYSFKNFVDALAFTQKIGDIAEAEGHHPDIALGWGYCDVLFYTHKIKGLHENDFIMAAKVNELYK